jgi:gas vesicle protein
MKKAFYLILAGVAIGILVAPEKGSETRRKLQEGFEDLKDQLMDQMNDLANQAKDMAGKAGETASEISDNPGTA